MTAPYEAPLGLIKEALEQAARRCGFEPTALHEELLGETRSEERRVGKECA